MFPSSTARITLGCAVAVLAAFGCSSTSDEPEGIEECADRTLARPGGCSSTSEEPEGIEVTGLVKRFQIGQMRDELTPLQDVEVCLMDRDVCDTSNAEGEYALHGIPADSDVVLTFDKEEFVPAVRMVRTAEAPMEILVETAMGAVGDLVEEAAGFEIEPMAGAIQVFAVTPGSVLGDFELRDEYQVSLTPEGNNPPLYMDDNGNFDPERTMSSSQGIAMFPNLEPGDYLVRFEHMPAEGRALECDQLIPGSGWPPESGSGAAVRVFEGRMTAQVGVLCQ